MNGGVSNQQVPDSDVVDQIREVMAFSDGDEEMMVEERESRKRGLSKVST